MVPSLLCTILLVSSLCHLLPSSSPLQQVQQIPSQTCQLLGWPQVLVLPSSPLNYTSGSNQLWVGNREEGWQGYYSRGHTEAKDSKELGVRGSWMERVLPWNPCPFGACSLLFHSKSAVEDDSPPVDRQPGDFDCFLFKLENQSL